MTEGLELTTHPPPLAEGQARVLLAWECRMLQGLCHPGSVSLVRKSHFERPPPQDPSQTLCFG